MRDSNSSSILFGWQEDWVLCRVFHKRKAEVASNSSNMENLESSSSPPFVDQSMPEEYCSEMMGPSFPTVVPHQEGNNSSSSSLLNLALLHYNLLDLPQDLDTSASMMGMDMGVGSKDDDFGFLLDVGLDDDLDMGMKGNVQTNVEDIRFKL